MNLTFIGADHEVTGSCHYLNACRKHILVDYGMEQGVNYYENANLPVNASDIDFVFLTHAHIDHSGLLPYLYGNGFRGSVFTTKATADLCEIMLRDSAHIQMFEVEWKNRKAKRAGKELLEPLYTVAEAEGVLKHFVPCEYDELLSPCDGIRIRFVDIGHLLGSAAIEVWITEKETTKKIVFSGDIGNTDQPIVKDPQFIEEADYVVMESTYGDRLHESTPDYIESLTVLLKETFDRGGNLVIPSFAVGRTQQMLYFFRKIKSERLVKGHENFEVYVDSPLAVEATEIFNEYTSCCFDEESRALIEQGINPILFPGLKLTTTSEESKGINANQRPKVIISASGMCEAGRIRHHLKHNLWRPESTILFVGYQAMGTLGRSLTEGALAVKLFGETIDVQAKIATLKGVSGHADQAGLIRWLNGFQHKPERVFIVHGEDQVCDIFADLLNEQYGYETYAPYTGCSFDLKTNQIIREGVKERIAKAKPAVSKASAVFARLMSAGQRLLTIIRQNEGGANKDLAKFADQINSLCDKWER